MKKSATAAICGATAVAGLLAAVATTGALAAPIPAVEDAGATFQARYFAAPKDLLDKNHRGTSPARAGKFRGDKPYRAKVTRELGKTSAQKAPRSLQESEVDDEETYEGPSLVMPTHFAEGPKPEADYPHLPVNWTSPPAGLNLTVGCGTLDGWDHALYDCVSRANRWERDMFSKWAIEVLEAPWDFDEYAYCRDVLAQEPFIQQTQPGAHPDDPNHEY